MFTAIIAEKEYIDKTKDYELFLAPFLASPDVAFCEWIKDAPTFAEMVPTLADTVGRREQWRAIIICDEAGLTKKNPFDLVSETADRFDGPVRGETEDGQTQAYDAFVLNEHQKKMRSFAEASQNALTRLVTHLCEAPTVTRPASSLDEDNDYARYLIEIEEKQRLRAQILADESLPISRPSEVVCIAKRTCPDITADYACVWETHTEAEYSRFYDRNMYFDKMRYLVFDILPKDHQNYVYDSIRFLYSTLIVASNEIPSGSLSPNRVYTLLCENNEEALRRLLFTYEAKLDLTKELLEQKIYEITTKKPIRFSDREAEQLFCTKIKVPVLLERDFDREELYASKDGIGLANGCPSEEEGLWESSYYKSRKALAKLFKQSRRALRRAAIEARQEDNIPLSGAELLTEFQIEDIEEHIANEEKAMITNAPPNLYDEEAYDRVMETENKAVRNKIKHRMYKRSTIVIGVLGLVAYALGFVTLFMKNTSTNFLNFNASLIITAAAIALMAGVALVTLFFLRKALTDLFDRFNWRMSGLCNDVEYAMNQSGVYLGHICNIRRGFSVLDAAKHYENTDRAKVTLYRKHILDIEAAKACVRDVFGHFMVNAMEIDPDRIVEYNYNYDRYNEYTYPLPYAECKGGAIDFVQKGIQVDVPVDFIRNLTVRREEIYD